MRNQETYMRNLPNAITLLRAALIPLLALLLLRRDYPAALVLFVVSALSDLADGLLARHWNLCSRFGAIADPLADKLTMLTVVLLLTMDGRLPWWFAASVVARDAVIVGGAIAYHLLIGHVEMAPSRLSKLNTALEFLLLAGVLSIAAGHVEDGIWRQFLLLATWITIVLSGTHYVAAWSRKAAQARRARK